MYPSHVRYNIVSPRMIASKIFHQPPINDCIVINGPLTHITIPIVSSLYELSMKSLSLNFIANSRIVT